MKKRTYEITADVKSNGADIEGAVKAHGAAKVQDTILSRAYAQEKSKLLHELTELTRQLTIGAEMYANERTGKSYMLYK